MTSSNGTRLQTVRVRNIEYRITFQSVSVAFVFAVVFYRSLLKSFVFSPHHLGYKFCRHPCQAFGGTWVGIAHIRREVPRDALGTKYS
jgi:hypothetical protein